jgi:hypothetical protein
MASRITDQMPLALAITAGLSTGYVFWRCCGWSKAASGGAGVVAGFAVKVIMGSGLTGRETSTPPAVETYNFSQVDTSGPTTEPIDWCAAVRAAVEAERQILDPARIILSWRSSGPGQPAVYGADGPSDEFLNSLGARDPMVRLSGEGGRGIIWTKRDLSATTQQEVNDGARRRLFYDSRWLAAMNTLQFIQSLLEGTDVLARNRWTLRAGSPSEGHAELVDAQGRVVQIRRPGLNYAVTFTGPLGAGTPAEAARCYVIAGEQFRQTLSVSAELEKLFRQILPPAGS